MNTTISSKPEGLTKKSSNYTKLLYVFVFGLLFLQIGIIIFFNLTQLKNHIGFDTSTYYYTAINMWEQKTVFLKNWNYQTTLNIDSSAPLAAIFYGIFGNIFFAYGLANSIIILLILFAFKKLLDCFDISILSQAVCLNLILVLHFGSSYSNVNSLVYGDVLFLNNAAYNVKTLLSIMIVFCVLELTKEKKNIPILIVTALLAFISGLSSGLWICVTIIAPILLLYFIKSFAENKWKELLTNKPFLFLIGITVISLIGKVIASRVLHYESKDSSMTLIQLEILWKNLGSLLLGYFDLLSAYPAYTEIQAVSFTGISYLINLLFAVLSLIAVVYVIKKKDFIKNEKMQVLVAIFLGDLLIFSLLNVTYGSAFFETRYLIVPYFFALVFFGKFYDAFFLKINEFLVIILTVGMLFITNFISNRAYYTNKNNYDELYSISEDLKMYDTPAVYVYGEVANIDARNLRVIDTTKIYKYVFEGSVYHWGDTTLYDDGNGLNEILVLVNKSSLDALPATIKTVIDKQEQVFENYVLLRLKSNPFVQ